MLPQVSHTLLSRAGQSSLISKSLYGILQGKGLKDEARLAWVLHQNASANAETMGEALGVDVAIS